jgi:hypothetical protein
MRVASCGSGLYQKRLNRTRIGEKRKGLRNAGNRDFCLLTLVGFCPLPRSGFKMNRATPAALAFFVIHDARPQS